MSVYTVLYLELTYYQEAKAGDVMPDDPAGLSTEPPVFLNHFCIEDAV